MKTHIYAVIIVALAASALSAQSVQQSSSSSSPPSVQQRSRSYGHALASTNYAVRQLQNRNREETVFIVPAATGQLEDFAPITEDLHVMCRIFDKMGSSRADELPHFSVLFAYENAQQTEALYLQGYGVVFFVTVPFALDFSEAGPATEAQTHSGSDPVWESIKEETLYGGPRSSDTDDHAERTQAMNRQTTAMLTERLLQTLRHASNIRSLSDDQKIVVRVTGQNVTRTRSSRGGRRVRSPGSSDIMGPYGGGLYGSSTRDPFAAHAASGPTTLIARTTKGDIDRYSKGELTFEQFKSRAKLIGLDNYVEGPVPAPAR